MRYAELFNLQGRVALVTGGSQGIGRAVARGYAEAGADVLIVARDEQKLAQAAAEIGDGLDVRVECIVADLTQREQLDQAAKTAVDRLDKVDILFNNAGTNVPEPLVDTADEHWDRVVELNLTACMRLARSLATGMIERKWGRIVHTSSVMAFASNPGRGLYSATKAALIGMTRAHALELGPHGITVNCLCPGPILTELPQRLLSDEQKKRYVERTAVGRWGDVSDMVGPALLLSSDAGAYVTGSALLAEGGMLCRTID